MKTMVPYRTFTESQVLLIYLYFILFPEEKYWNNSKNYFDA